ncbi:MAG TPA: AMP-binding protein [Chloroflexota bacterium]|nr:AMP-binding protein [Chloroflexota bacterium]
MNVAELLDIPASMFPEQEILRFDARSLTYEELQALVQQTAGALHRLGVGRGDRVAVVDTNSADLVVALFAIVSVGAVFVPLSYRGRADEWQHMLDAARPKIVLAADRYVEECRAVCQACTDSPVLMPLSPSREGVSDLRTLAEKAEPTPFEDVDDDDLAVLMFTSGSTAVSKAVMLAHADLVNYVCESVDCADGSDRGAALLSAPLHHIAGLTATLSAIFAGRRLVLMPQFDAARWLEMAQRERVTHAFLVPTMLKRVLDCEQFEQADLSRLQLLSYGAAPMPLGVIRRAIESFPPSVQFINAFGQTETTSTVTMLSPDDHRLEGAPEEVQIKLRRLGSIGRALPEVEVRILDEAGEPVSRGQVGEIALRTPRTMRGYFGQDEATAVTIRDGWLLTRDLAWMDEDGYIFLTGRKADLIIRGGENIAPQEVELILESHPNVEEVAVVGVPDDEWGERVCAVVVARANVDLSEAELIEWCHERLASFKKPETVIFTQSLPRNPLGKLMRSELRAQIQSPTLNGEANGE